MKNQKQKTDKVLHTAKYKSKFLKPTEFIARGGKTVYISKEFHQRLTLLVFMLGEDKLTLSDYLHNLLLHHFDDFGAEMKELYNKIEKPTF